MTIKIRDHLELLLEYWENLGELINYVPFTSPPLSSEIIRKPFCSPWAPENTRKPKVFWCFQEVWDYFLIIPEGIEVSWFAYICLILETKFENDSFHPILRQRQLNFCSAGSRENYFRSAGQQNNNNNPKFKDQHI